MSHILRYDVSSVFKEVKIVEVRKVRKVEGLEKFYQLAAERGKVCAFATVGAKG